MNNEHSEIHLLSRLLLNVEGEENMESFLLDFFTPAERKALQERWLIAEKLLTGETQRTVRDELNVSISKVSRCSSVLQNGSGAFQLLYEKLKKQK